MPRPLVTSRLAVRVVATSACAALLGAGLASTSAAPPPVLSTSVALVVKDPAALNAGENRLRQRWENAGLVVQVLNDNTITSAAAEAHGLVFVSSSVPPRVAAVRDLATAHVPVWLTKSALFDDFGLTGSARSEWGQKQGGTVTVVDPAHPAAAGRTGTVTVQGANRYVGWGNPTADAAVVGETAGDPSVFTIGSGDTLEWGTPAPSCRSVFPAVGGAPTSYTADGWAMFDAMTQWALSCPLPPPPPPPSGEVEQVVLVSMDGLNPQALVDLGPAGVPSITRMRTEGASTLNARTVVERTETLPNHVSMVTSRWVDLPDGTGVTFNSDNSEHGARQRRWLRPQHLRRRARRRRVDRPVRHQGQVRLHRPVLRRPQRRTGRDRRGRRHRQDRHLPAQRLGHHDRPSWWRR